MKSPPKQMNYLFDAFKLHDQEGFPLECSVDYGRTCGTEVNMACFACDALAAGWPEEKVGKTIEGARPDLNWTEMRNRLAALWTVTGKLPDPRCWPDMKKFVIDAQLRNLNAAPRLPD